MSIKEYFSKIIEKQKTMGYPFPSILSPGASLASINLVERELDLEFNKELIELYTFADGTAVDPGTPNGKTGLIPIYSFLNLKDATVYFKNYIAHQELFMNLETDSAPAGKMFPFLEDGAGNCYWVDLNSSPNQNKIYWTNTFGENPDYLFESLTKFFCVVHECYNSDLLFLDDDQYLEFDDLDFARVAEKHNPNLSYWGKFLAEEE